jgi:hypothetical protein
LVVDLVDVLTAAAFGSIGLDVVEVRQVAATLWGAP